MGRDGDRAVMAPDAFGAALRAIGPAAERPKA
jgi:hypothetical protein